MCGEKAAAAGFYVAFKGSPPRVRGKVKWCHVAAENNRITPACAGKRGVGRKGGDVMRDHPRVCGEK